MLYIEREALSTLFNFSFLPQIIVVYVQMLFDEVTIQFHHGGYFTDPPNSVYIGGVVDEITNFDIDKASFF